MKSASKFRSWVYQQWLDNCDEHDRYNEPKNTFKEYWMLHATFLKIQYRKHQFEEKKKVDYKISHENRFKRTNQRT